MSRGPDLSPTTTQGQGLLVKALNLSPQSRNDRWLHMSQMTHPCRTFYLT
eukprot:jgi/Botrbrau1/9509/Bobra.0252s0124.1